MKKTLIFIFLLIFFACEEEVIESFHGIGYDHVSSQKFDKEVIAQVSALDSLKNFFIKNRDTIISFTYKDLDLSMVVSRVGEEPSTIESFTCVGFGSYYGSLDSPSLPDVLIPEFKTRLSEIDTSRLHGILICKDKEVEFICKEERINDSVLVIHSIAFHPVKPKNKEYYFKFHKDTMLNGNLDYNIYQTFNYKSPPFEKKLPMMIW